MAGLTFCCFRPLAAHTRVLEEDALPLPLLLQIPLLYIVPVSLSQFQSAHASLMHFSKAAALSTVEVPLSSFFCERRSIFGFV